MRRPMAVRIRRLSRATIGLTAAAMLGLAANAQASITFNALTALTGNADYGVSANCTSSAPTSSVSAEQALPVNGATRTFNATSGITATANSDASDQVSVNAFVTGHGRITGGAGQTRIHVDYAGSASSSSTKPTSACVAHAYPIAGVRAFFTITDTSVITIDSTQRGTGGSRIVFASGDALGTSQFPGLINQEDTPNLPPFGYRQHQQWVIPPGSYSVILGGYVQIAAKTTRAAGAGRGTIDLTLVKAGQRTATSGTTSYVTTPPARTCATHSISPRITTNAKRAKQIKSVAFRVNGRLVKTVKAPHKGASVKLGAPDDQSATVVAKARLRNGKTATSTASYLQCS